MISLTPDSLLRRRSRNQTNFPTEAFQLGENAVYLKSQVPEPEEEFLRYEAQELELLRDTDSEPVTGEQVIMDETSSSRDVAQQLHVAREERRHLYRQIALERKALRADALARSRITVKKWVKVPMTVQRPIFRISIQRKLVRVRVDKKPIQVPRTFHRRLPSGKIQQYAMLVWVQPRTYVDMWRIKRRRIRVGTKLVTRNLRVSKLVSTVNWAKYRLTLGEALDELGRRYGSQLFSLQSRIEGLRRRLASLRGQPNTLKTWTTCGLVPVGYKSPLDPDIPGAWSISSSTVLSRYALMYRQSRKAEFDSISHTATGRQIAPHGAFWQILWFRPLRPASSAALEPLPLVVEGEAGDTNGLLDSLRSRMATYEYPFAVQSTYEDALESVTFDSRKALPEPTRVVDRSEGDGSLDRNSVLNAATRVASLIKRGDTKFRVLRSLLELKDTPELARPGRQFLAFIAAARSGSEKLPSSLRIKRVGHTVLTGLQLLAGCYLTKKMAIEPTISDIETCINESRKWIVAARRSLVVLLDELKKTKTNILHYRVKAESPGSPRSDLATVEVDTGPSGTVSLKQFVTVDKAFVGEQSLAAQVAESDVLRKVETTLVEAQLRDCEQPFTKVAEPLVGLVDIDSEAGPNLAVKPQDVLGKISYLTEGRVEPLELGFRNHIGEYRLGDGSPVPPIQPDVSLEQKAAVLRAVTGAEWPRPPGTVYVMNRVTAVAFARYSVDVVREYSSYLSSGSLTELVDGLTKMESLEAAAQSIGAVKAVNADEIRIIWDLAPLSFVFEWFSTIGDVIDRLNAFAEERVAPLPTSLDGTWATMRCDLLAGMPQVDITSFGADAQVTSWFVSILRRKFPGAYSDESDDRVDEVAVAVPRGYTITYKYTYQQAGGSVGLSRTGLYRAIRGPVTPTFGDIITPHVYVRLSGDKLTSLVALLTSFLGGKR